MSHETTQLISNCLNGQPDAPAMLIQRFKSQVFGLCFRMLGQREDAEDATQETFIRVIQNLHRWDPDRRFEPWLFTIAGNRCRTKLQKRNRQKEVQLGESIDVECQSRSGSGLMEEIRIAVETLAKKHRQAFQLFHEDQQSYLEIADQMSVPVGTIKTWVHRARRQIVDQLRRRKTLEQGI